jgi:CubicO group peptidase (beta-lactamase class C family)
MTKPITCLALMQLHEQGMVLLENKVSRFIPAFADTQVWAGGTKDDYQTVPPEREMTVHDVLTHMSGLTAGFHWTHPLHDVYRDNHLGGLTRSERSLEEACDLAASLPLNFSPGTAWGYGMSTDVVGRIVEVVSGMPLDQYFREHILDPLGMADTEFWVPEEKLPRLTANYIRGKGRELTAWGRKEALTTRPTFLSGAGGLASTAADYQRFLTMLVNGGQLDGQQIIGPRTLAFMATNHLPGGSTLDRFGTPGYSETLGGGTGFGLGVSVVVDPAALGQAASVGEYGWGGAASTQMWVDPAEELTCLFLTQLVPSGLYPIRRQLRATVYQALTD